MPPPKRPGPKQNLWAKVRIIYQTAKDFNKKVAYCRKKAISVDNYRLFLSLIPYYIYKKR